MPSFESSPNHDTLVDHLLVVADNRTIRQRKHSGPGRDTSGRNRALSHGTGPWKRTKPQSFLHKCTHFALKRTWTIPLVLLFSFLCLYSVNPTESNIIHHYIFLSYKQQPLNTTIYDQGATQRYGKGVYDIALVCFYTIVLPFMRELIMQEMLRPLARRWGIKSRGKHLRFMEQMYTAIYFAFIGPAGIYIMRGTPVWYFNTSGMYENFPHKTHEASFKFSYLFQAANWLQQAIVMLLGAEKRRKDFKELMGHHVVTLTLITLSYRFHFTYMGLAIYITHDISKCLNYTNHPSVGVFFGVSVSLWIYLRHYLNLHIIFSLFTEFRTVGPYELNWETEQYKCLLSNIITLGLLGALQALNMFWLFCLLRIGYRYVWHNVAKDERSDSEPEETELLIKGKAPFNELPLLDYNHVTDGSANGVTESNGNETRSPSSTKS